MFMVRGTNKLLKKSPDRSGRKRNQTAFIYLNTRQARISIEYTQRNTMANVTGTIENEDCGASSGGYTVAVRYRDENGEIHDDEHPETWQRDDDQPFSLNNEYLIDDVGNH
jgi:hypothetical protein